MNFEIQSMDLSGAATHKADALVVLVSQSFKPVKGALSDLIAAALKAGDLESKAGKFGAFVLFLGLAFGMVGFVAKYLIQWMLDIK